MTREQIGHDTPTDDKTYSAWLGYNLLQNESDLHDYRAWCSELVVCSTSVILQSAVQELTVGMSSMLGEHPSVVSRPTRARFVLLGVVGTSPYIDGVIDQTEIAKASEDAYFIQTVTGKEAEYVLLAGKTDCAALYAAFHFLRLLQTGQRLDCLSVSEHPRNRIRMINHWDNMDGRIERGYAGASVFFEDNRITHDLGRIKDYARLLSSVGLNAITINNVNVHQEETKLITNAYLPDVAKLAAVLRQYGIQLFLSINFASPIEIGGLQTADPIDPSVKRWWRERAQEVYSHIPDFGGFLVKADSEFRPGPFTYGRNHVDGANTLAEALKDYGGLVIWRCFVYNCLQDWRDRSIDRAKAAYEHFKPLDGKFHDNVVLQIKNGPMDFQVREPVSSLLGALRDTNQILEVQITQEYTGQQKHLCYLVPQWKEVLDFDTHAFGVGSTVARLVDGSLTGRLLGGFASVSNVGDDLNWTGHPLAQANLYGYGRLAWNPNLSAADITDEWVRSTFGNDFEMVTTISEILLQSWPIYESYTSPLGVGWMVNPGHHYGPNVDGYEYSKWGTYHFADCYGIGVNRTVANGTGYAGQYHEPQSSLYNSIETCPDELLLFFHHVSYQHRLRTGKTVIQHIYDSHFDGVTRAEWLQGQWSSLQKSLDSSWYKQVLQKFAVQIESAKEWRDVINTYFLRKSGISDEQGREIY